MWFCDSTSGFILHRTESRVSEKYLLTHVQSSIIHSNLKVEATECPLSGGWTNIMWSIYTMEYDSLRKERNPITCYNLDEPRRHHASWNLLVTKRHILYDFTYMRYLRQSDSETESRLVVPGVWGEGNDKDLFNGHRFSVWQDKNILEICYTTMWIYLILLDYILKNVKMKNSMGLFFYHIKTIFFFWEGINWIYLDNLFEVKYTNTGQWQVCGLTAGIFIWLFKLKSIVYDTC